MKFWHLQKILIYNLRIDENLKRKNEKKITVQNSFSYRSQVIGISINWTKKYRVYWHFQNGNKNRIPGKCICIHWKICEYCNYKKINLFHDLMKFISILRWFFDIISYLFTFFFNWYDLYVIYLYHSIIYLYSNLFFICLMIILLLLLAFV